MDSGAQAAWIAALIGLIGWLTSLMWRKEDGVSKASASELKKINETLERFQGHHARHFDEHSALRSANATLASRFEDHLHQDEERFKEIREMHSEIRDDIKTLLSRSTER